MIVPTIYGPTDKKTGEILDLSPLRTKPAGPRTRRIKHRTTRRYPRARSLERETLLTLCTFAVVSCIFWLNFGL